MHEVVPFAAPVFADSAFAICKSVVFLVLLASLFTAPCLAQGLSPHIEDTPLGQFDDKDLSLFEAAQSEALERRADGVAVSWQNPETGASGTVTPTGTARIGGRHCRQLEIVNRAGNRTGETRFWFCKMPDSQWKIVSPE